MTGVRRVSARVVEEFSVVGKRLPKLDAPQKVTGQTAYAEDVRMSGLLVGAILRSPHAHARIRSIDVSAAEQLPGVRAVIHAGNVEQRPFGYDHDKDSRINYGACGRMLGCGGVSRGHDR